MSSAVIDAFEFCRRNETRDGKIDIGASPRLAKELAAESGALVWTLRGDADKAGNYRLQLSVSGTVQLLCQRCLGAMDFVINSHSVLILAENEARADELEEMLAEEDLDVVVGSPALDILTLVEDEVLLALPLAPRHATCTASADLSEAQKDGVKPSPFEALGQWKKQTKDQ